MWISVVGGSYALARGIYTSVARDRQAQLRRLVTEIGEYIRDGASALAESDGQDRRPPVLPPVAMHPRASDGRAGARVALTLGSDYSARKASTGSTEMARRAGPKAAASAATASTAATRPSVSPSHACTLNNRLPMRRDAPTGQTSPMANPTPVSHAA